MKITTKYIILGVILTVLIGTGLYFYLNPKRALNFVVPNFTGLANVGVEIKGDTAYLDVNTVMENKAPYAINVKKIDYTICLEETDILKEKHVVNLEQKPGQIDTANLLVRLPYKNVRDVIESIQNQDSTTIEATFSITYETIFGEVTIPAAYDTKVKTPNPPEIELNKIRLGFFNFKETKFELILDLDVTNENDIEVSLDNLEYEAEFGKNLTGYGELDERLTVEANAKTNIRLPIVISVDKPMKIVWDIITNKDRMGYILHLRGQLVQKKADRENIDFDVSVNGDAELVK